MCTLQVFVALQVHCTLFTHLAQFSSELEAVLISHVGEQEGVDGTSLGGIPLSCQGEQLLLTLRLLELVVHCKQRTMYMTMLCWIHYYC